MTWRLVWGFGGMLIFALMVCASMMAGWAEKNGLYKRGKGQ